MPENTDNEFSFFEGKDVADEIEETGDIPDSPDDLVDRKSLTIKVENGIPLWDSMRETTREQWLNVLGHESTKKFTGKNVMAIVDNSMASKIILLLGTLNSTVGTAALKLNLEEAEILKYSQEECDAIGPMLANVLNKYGADFKYMDEVMLASSLCSLTFTKYVAVVKLRNQRKQQ